MSRTDTRKQTIFYLPHPATATLNLTTRNHIRITVPAGSTWRVAGHWHTPETLSECSQLHVEEASSANIVISTWLEPRNS